jgi:hypothetical protein
MPWVLEIEAAARDAVRKFMTDGERQVVFLGSTFGFLDDKCRIERHERSKK